jgi:phosphatidate cytidylyltransferase
LALWIAAYLGLLPSFFAQLRWLAGTDKGVATGTQALALALFVPKGCDIGAYFTGRLLGRHRMTPILSPKKTWEGFAGGMLAAVAIAIGLGRMGPALRGSDWLALGFGLTVGLAGILGDLAESLIKRDSRHKDAAQNVPGFGGVLDVVDAVVFAAPVAYAWLR